MQRKTVIDFSLKMGYSFNVRSFVLCDTCFGIDAMRIIPAINVLLSFTNHLHFPVCFVVTVKLLYQLMTSELIFGT